MSLENHPAVLDWRQSRAQGSIPAGPAVLSAAEVRQMALECGADDAGVVDMERPALDGERPHVLGAHPATRSLVSLVARLNPANVRCPHRSVSDREYLHGMHAADRAARDLGRRLAKMGVSALSFPSGFPMDLSLWPGRMWQVSHKLVAVEAGLGRMGLNRLVLHPRFGGFVILSTLLVDRPMDSYDQPLDWDPCLGCKLCAAVCPVGAVGADGSFNFVNCLTHNYRDRLGGFSDWVENLAASRGAADYRSRVSDRETVSMWQSLSYGICNKSSYCMAVCPAGRDNLGPWLEDRAAYGRAVMEPLKAKQEEIYVVPGSDAEAHLAKRFPHKRAKRVGNGLRPASVAGFLSALDLIFQPGRAQGLKAVYHFSFFGAEQARATVIIDNGRLSVMEGHEGRADLSISADSGTWLGFLAGEKKLLPALLSRKLRIKGPPRLMRAFAACFPS